MKFRAICVTEKKPVGPWRDTKADAVKDAKVHTAATGHHCNIEVKQSQ